MRVDVFGTRLLDQQEGFSLLEAEMGVEPIHVGFADQCLPSWLLRRYRHIREFPAMEEAFINAYSQGGGGK